MTQRKIYLHGDLAKTYGAEAIVVDADTTRMVFTGLYHILGNKFKEVIRTGEFHIFKGKGKKNDLGEEEVNFTLGKCKELHVWPVIQGASAIARVIIGVILVVVAVFTSWFSPATSALMLKAGAVLIMGGVAELLAPKPKINAPQNQAGQNPSYLFNGTVNVTEQGGPVPVVLGRVRRASSVVLSAGLTTENLPV